MNQKMNKFLLTEIYVFLPLLPYSDLSKSTHTLVHSWTNKQIYEVWAVVVAQLVERSLSIPEVHGLNLVIDKKLYWTYTVNCIEKTKIKKKRPGTAHF